MVNEPQRRVRGEIVMPPGCPHKSGYALPLPVMPGFMPGIHVLWLCNTKDVDGRDKSGHDVETHCVSTVMPALVTASRFTPTSDGIHVLTTSTQARVIRMDDARASSSD